MKSILLKSRVQADGILELRVPTDLPESDVEVVVVVQPISDGDEQKSSGKSGWPPGFFERTAGAWQGEPLVREPQGEYEDRDKLS
ncbi:MAG: hypothetical protein A3F84_15280 [Candidatus Handelsmanbacteria bacterium RIFCSPLOWO2_12_FULL_64_10]|uniref:Uncharacterized protein n=1 Tax=Handelsmanbacteria sp. (strain RIFCSPLOWO2_12_FULL_64_10) TaxID=1817868 RepID=A0A1F6CS12_HANXR|nr:MAG: hypothetical protein A3F84_15280 [Candidatus Handelsmanbacteria bacterium RIFCSPLOWO2_12_FULL_64_10]